MISKFKVYFCVCPRSQLLRNVFYIPRFHARIENICTLVCSLKDCRNILAQ